jgi:uncharacterized protein
VSSFEPRVHLFGARGLNLAYDANSGALHTVDETARQILLAWNEAGGSPAGPSPGPAHAELHELIAAGRLFAPAPVLPAEVPDVGLRALCLHLAHDCNLTCAYCFAAGGALGGPRSLMPASTARASVELLLAESRGYPYLAVDFFGGEPLLNWDVLTETVRYARRRGTEEGRRFRFTVTTNAFDVTPAMASYLAANMDNLVLSLDGRPEIHDRMRRANSAPGGPTHAACLANARLVVDALARRRQGEQGPLVPPGSPGSGYYLRGTFTPENLDFHRDVEYLVGQGFDQISIEPVVLAGGPLALGREHLADVAAAYEELALLYVRGRREGKPFTFYHFELDGSSGPCLERRITGCGAGHQYLAVTPEGELYPCHQFVGRPGYRFGNILDGATVVDGGKPAGGGITASGAAFRHLHVGAKPACASCWAWLLCGGGCHANADLARAGRLDQPYAMGCELTRLRWEWALWARAALDLNWPV